MSTFDNVANAILPRNPKTRPTATRTTTAPTTNTAVRARGRNHVLTNRLMHVAHAGIYVLQVCMYAAVWFVSLPASPEWLPSPFLVWEMNDVFFGLYSLAMLATILVYGTRIWRQFKDVPLESASKRSMMRQVTFTTVVCSVCFLARAVYSVFFFMPISATAWAEQTDAEVVTLSILYYALGELAPNALVLYLFRKVPSVSRVQYSSIP